MLKFFISLSGQVLNLSHVFENKAYLHHFQNLATLMASKMFLGLSGDIKMPAIGLGTWQSEDEEIEKALDTALEIGYRHIDTAYIYGNEHIIGKVLKKWLSEGKVKRKELFITTKLPPPGLHADKVEYFLKKSLDKLQLDYVDLYLIHNPVGMKFREDWFRSKSEDDLDPNTDHIGVWKSFEEQVDAGRTKAIGVSNFTAKQIERILSVARIKPANLQIEIHACMQQRALVDFCKKNGISVVAYSPLGTPGYRHFLDKFGMTKEVPDILGNPVVKKVAQKNSKTPAQVLLRHTLQRGIGVIPKSVKAARLKENIDVFDFKLDEEDIIAIDSLEIGPSARICDFNVHVGFYNHPECPFK